MFLSHGKQASRTSFFASVSSYHDNQDGVRPDEITVNLLADGKKVDSKTVTAKDGWKYEFNDLDKFKAGQPIKYSISEDKVTGYKTTVNGYDLTNILNAIYYLNDKKGLRDLPLTKVEKFGLEAFLKKIKGTYIEEILVDQHLLQE